MRFVFVVLALSVFVAAQDHAPTHEQCKADANLWMAQVKAEPGVGLVNDCLDTAAGLKAKIHELNVCGLAHPHKVSESDLKAFWLWVGLQGRLTDRQKEFLRRRGLLADYNRKLPAALEATKLDHPALYTPQRSDDPKIQNGDPIAAKIHDEAAFMQHYLNARNLEKKFYAEDSHCE
jgi:hypothetical protein